MNPELIAAIKQRIDAGRSFVEIETEVTAAGYTKEVFSLAHESALLLSQSAINNFTPAVIGNGGQLIGYREMFSTSWLLALSQYKVFLKTLVVALVLIGVIGGVLFSATLLPGLNAPVTFIIIFLVLPILAFLVALLAMFSVMRALLARNTEAGFRDHLRWTAVNIFSLSLVSLYLTIITQVGYMLLIIPGIISTVYLLFATTVVFADRARGIAALVMSTELVYGRFWPVLGRFLFSNVGIWLLLAIVLILGTVITALVPLFFLVVILASLFCLYWLFCSLVVLYESVASLPLAAPLPLSAKNLTRVYMSIIGLAVFIIVFIFGIGAVLGFNSIMGI